MFCKYNLKYNHVQNERREPKDKRKDGRMM